MMKEIEVRLTRIRRKSINVSCGMFPVIIKGLTYDLDRHDSNILVVLLNLSLLRLS